MTEQLVTPVAQLPPHEETHVIEVSLREVLLGGVVLGIGILVIGTTLTRVQQAAKRQQVDGWFDRIERLITTVLPESHPGKEEIHASTTIAGQQ